MMMYLSYEDSQEEIKILQLVQSSMKIDAM